MGWWSVLVIQSVGEWVCIHVTVHVHFKMASILQPHKCAQLDCLKIVIFSNQWVCKWFYVHSINDRA